MFRFTFLLFSLFSCGTFLLLADDTGVGPNLLAGNFEMGQPSYNPWAGVDDMGKMHVWAGTQLSAGESGTVGKLPFGPSIAVGDLNADGLPDLIVGDTRGFFWYFPNSGKPNAPVFTQGEVMPIWLYPAKVIRDGKAVDTFLDGDVVPHLQLIDYTGEKKLSIVSSNFAGQLFYIHNAGSSSVPHFLPTQDLDSLEVPTHSDNLLWCNYLAPFLYDWSGTGRLDLTMGDGSYSANSIYLITNKGTNDRPIFREDNRTKIIPGMGKEQLIPQVVDWNNDGKPDIITAERAGYIDVYLNQADEKNAPPVFDMNKFQHVTFGSTDNVGLSPTVCVADLNNDGLFDLIVGNSDGTISYSLNTGTLGSPKFGPLIPLKGVYPYPKISLPLSWQIDRVRPYGSPDELLETVNAQSDPAFVPLPDFSGKGAMKFSIVKPKPVFFADQFVPANMTRAIVYYNKITLQTGVSYNLTLWVRSDGEATDFQWNMAGTQTPLKGEPTFAVLTGDPFGSASSSWLKLTQQIRIHSIVKGVDDSTPFPGLYTFSIWFKGNGTVYFDNISLQKAN